MGFSDRFTFKEIIELNNFCDENNAILMDEANRKGTAEDFLKDIDIILPLGFFHNFGLERTYEDLENTVNSLNTGLDSHSKKILKNLKIEWRIPTRTELSDLLFFINPFNERVFSYGRKYDLWGEDIWSCSDSCRYNEKIVLCRRFEVGKKAKDMTEVLSLKTYDNAKAIIVGKIIKSD